MLLDHNMTIDRHYVPRSVQRQKYRRQTDTDSAREQQEDGDTDRHTVVDSKRIQTKWKSS